MLDSIIYEFILSDYTHEISSQKWLAYSKAYAQENDKFKRTAFLKAIANHSGISIQQISATFNLWGNGNVEPAEQERLLTELHELQTLNTTKITQFQEEHPVLKRMNLESLSLTRSEWNALITQFEQRQRQKITFQFVINTLSAMRRMPAEQLTESLNVTGPQRSVKRKFTSTKPQVRNIRPFYVDDGGVNPLIYEGTGGENELEAKLEQEGVRVTPLSCATPEKRYPNLELYKTPGESKVRPVCRIHRGGNKHTLFKHLTPYKKTYGQGRIDVSDVAEDEVHGNLLGLFIEKAAPVEYVATLQVITERSGIGRQSALSIMGISAANVVRAHGIEISQTAGRTIHWYHLIANFLADTQDLIVADSTKKIINLVPSTAAANYNTLEAIELFIRKTLVDKMTEQVRIRVTPEYTGEGLIPDLLTYTLTWTEKSKNDVNVDCSEEFYIFPQSSYRFTKTVHTTIQIIRDESLKNALDKNSDDHELPRSYRM